MERLKRLAFAQLAPAGYIKRAATPSKALEANRDGMRIKQRRSQQLRSLTEVKLRFITSRTHRLMFEVYFLCLISYKQ